MKVISIKENYVFRRLYAKGKSSATPYLALYCRHTHRPYNRLGITVSTKLGKAVRRNKIRRRLREIYRTHQDQFSCGWDLVVVARIKSARAKYSVLEKNFLSLSDKLGLLKTSKPRPKRPTKPVKHHD